MTGPMEVIGPIQGEKGPDIVPPSLDQAREFARHGKAENTLGGYRADWRDFRRPVGTAPTPKSPILTDDIRAMVDAADAGLIGAQDRALVLLAQSESLSFFAAMKQVCRLKLPSSLKLQSSIDQRLYPS
jgi:hypothetical protein